MFCRHQKESKFLKDPYCNFCSESTNYYYFTTRHSNPNHHKQKWFPNSGLDGVPFILNFETFLVHLDKKLLHFLIHSFIPFQGSLPSKILCIGGKFLPL